MKEILLNHLGSILAYLKSTPSIVLLLINTSIAIAVIILGRLKKWLSSSKYIFRFSSLLSVSLTFITYVICRSMNLLPDSAVDTIIYLVVFFILINIVIFISIYLSSDKSAMGKHENQLDQDIKEPEFNERLKRVTEALSTNLRDIDNQTNWSVLNFVPLDAEVELIRDGKHREKKVTDLLKAIKSSKSERLFLVIGDPGAGKSVALRKLCQDLAKEVKDTGKIPVYINLKEWQDKWDVENVPTVEQLNNFVLKNLKKRDIVTTDFFNKYYGRLYEQGRLYFIFDSFDEIPSVLGEKENSLLIKQLSSVMHDFLSGARQKSQGILASRIFRRPTEEFKTRAVLEIRPFSEYKINQTFYKTLGYEEKVVNDLFKHRFDLLSSASNPFMASLIATYVKDNQNKLPDNVLELYEGYFSSALNNSEEIIESNGVTNSLVMDICLGTADLMFKNYGFEIKVSTIKENIGLQYRPYIDQAIDVLQFARIGRRSRETGLFSFSHRRFCEFFVVKQMLIDAEDLHLTDIPKDSQWRDALVMYCQVSNEAQALSIARYCWEIISAKGNVLDLEAIHCMRFLRDAFKARPNVIEPFRAELSSYILNSIDVGGNIIPAKLCTECLGLLEEAQADQGAVSAMDTNNIWLIETAIKSCRTLPQVSAHLNKNIKFYVTTFVLSDYLRRNTDLSFSLSLSTAMKEVKSYYTKLVIDTWLLLSIIAVWLPVCMIYSKDKISVSFVGLFLIYFTFNLNMRDGLPSFMPFFVRNILWGFYLVTFAVIIPPSVLSKQSISIIISLLFIFHVYLVHSVISVKKILKFIFSKEFVKLSGFMLVSVSAVGIVFIAFFGLDYLIKKYFGDTVERIAIYSFFGSIGLFIIFIFTKEFIVNYKVFKSIKYNRCNDRAYISEVIESFSQIKDLIKSVKEEEASHNYTAGKRFKAKLENNPIENYFLGKFISYLETNIQHTKGNWTHTSIFLAYHQNLPLTRLARLEEKWLGLNR